MGKQPQKQKTFCNYKLNIFENRFGLDMKKIISHFIYNPVPRKVLCVWSAIEMNDANA